MNSLVTLLPRYTGSHVDRVIRNHIFKKLAALEHGCLQLIDHTTGQEIFFGANNSNPICIEVHDARFYRAIALNADIGAGQAWADGWWHTADLKAALQLLLQNAHLWAVGNQALSALSQPLFRLRHWARRNSVQQAKKNIAAHYDLGNEFYAQWLDKRMLYSSGIYLQDTTTLEEAQLEKIDRICRKLELRPGQTVLEIGSGWGGFAIHAAQHYGVAVTTITISTAQYHYCQQAIARAGVEALVKPQLLDYRKIKGQFDAIVSIEMIEAVGHNYLPSYFHQINSNLKPNGKALIQAITAHDQNYQDYLQKSDFIREYIFPGGSLPSLGAIQTHLTQHTDMQITHLEDIAQHYARTLDDWYQNLLSKREDLPAQNRQTWFFRIWEFYLQSCSALFTERKIGTMQILMVKPGCKTRTPLSP